MDPSRHAYTCPAERQLDVAFVQTPKRFSILSFAASWVPTILFFTGGLSFIFVCLYLAIFRCACPALPLVFCMKLASAAHCQVLLGDLG